MNMIHYINFNSNIVRLKADFGYWIGDQVGFQF